SRRQSPDWHGPRQRRIPSRTRPSACLPSAKQATATAAAARARWPRPTGHAGTHFSRERSGARQS
ncbi:hypothetical protein E4U54_006512, partial [Claviceps lovelessii]